MAKIIDRVASDCETSLLRLLLEALRYHGNGFGLLSYSS